jgi:hypothetical protein
MNRFRALAIIIACLMLLPVVCFGQSSNAALTGTVSDAAKALMPGVTVTATNTETGIASSGLSNESGVYSVSGLLPGIYDVTAELPGFQTQKFTGVRLGNAAQARLNFELQVANVNTTVEVTVAAERLLIESTSSVGAVLPETAVRDLPIVGTMGNDAMGLVRTLPGVNLSNDLINSANDSKLAGVSAANIVVQRDGVDSSAAGRWPAGFQAATIVNPDLVGEIRMVIAPVDAEIGGGNAQIQIQTRSGTNRYRGAAVWNIRNSALDGNTWANNRIQPRPPTRSWTNVNEYSGNLGGPIIKNKTFFFVLYDGLIPLTRTEVNATVLTPCAARGIFRYFDNWSNGNAQQVESGGATPRTAVVDYLGNPKTPERNPNGTPFTGQLRYASVFGPLAGTPSRADCSDAVVQGSPWDPFRRGFDASGYVAKVLGVMPAVNNYDIGEGLNTAGHRWVRRTSGTQNRFGFGFTDARKQLNAKIDHNFNARNKVNATWTMERVHSDYGQTPWDTARFDGIARRFPQVLGINYTSTLTPSMVNEVRWGMRRTGTNTIHGLAHNPEAREFVPQVQGTPVVMHLGLNALTQAPVICFCGGQPLFQTEAGNLFNGNIAEKTPLYTYADTLSWTRGVHSFKGGFEARFSSSELKDDVDSTAWSTFARAFGGETQYTPIQGINSTNMPGLQGTATTGNVLAMRSLLTLLSGSISEIHQLYFLGSSQQLDKFDDYRDSVQRTRELNQRQYSAFFKDDWKISRNWTLNLGARWDYHGVPWVSNGLTVSPLGGGDALFGYSGRGFDNWMQPGKRGDSTQLIFVGPDSPNSGQSVWKKDYNNFGPAIGFAWNVPYFGAGKTVVRGGYQVSYLSGGGRFNTLNGPLANPPGSSYNAVFNGSTGMEYLDLTRINSLVPVPITQRPMVPIGERDRTVSLTAIDSNYTTPYIQNLTLAVTRNVGNNLTLDARYIGTLSRKLYDSININSSNFLYNGLREAFDAARNGGESELLDRMFRGVNVAGTGCTTASGTSVTCGAVGTTVNGVLQTGAMHLRAATSGNLRNNLANGNYMALANTLYTLNYSKTASGNAALPDIPAGELGAVLRYNGFAENFIKANPQFNNATLLNNSGNTNYHSLQIQTTIRRMPGISDMQASYTWSKLLGRTGPYTNPVDQRGDYTLQTGDIRHDFRTNGTFELPVGPGQLLAGNSSGILAHVIGGWKMSWIIQLSSGAATNISAATTLYANGVPDLVGPFDPSLGKVQWQDGALNGNYFGDVYRKVVDPQCTAIAGSLRSACTLSAIADASGTVILQNPQPGTRGNLGQNVIEQPGVWTFDAGLGKRFRITESKSFMLRMDATNVFNHPQPANPNLDINNATPFGNIATKTGVRTFQAQLRLDF